MCDDVWATMNYAIIFCGPQDFVICCLFLTSHASVPLYFDTATYVTDVITAFINVTKDNVTSSMYASKIVNNVRQ